MKTNSPILKIICRQKAQTPISFKIIMGHSHSSLSHKRLKSISSAKNYGEFTEIVDIEFSDVAIEPTINKRVSQEIHNKLSEVAEYPEALLSIEKHVKELEESIEKMSADEFFVHFPTLKDNLHNCWQKVYSIKEENFETKCKKHEIIDNVRELLKKLNNRLQRRT